jgi:alanine racemase
MREIRIDLDRIRENYEVLRRVARPAKVMAVVKANAYGHGAIEVAKHLDEDVDYLGVADVHEAASLREAGIKSPLMAWIANSLEDFELAKIHNIDIGISTFNHLDFLEDLEGLSLHVKVDTGLSRNGFSVNDFPEAVERLQVLTKERHSAKGIFTHLSNTNEEEDLSQFEIFETAIEFARGKGLEFELAHASASNATLSYPNKHFDMVRCGIAIYGLSPDGRDISGLPLKPAMSVSSEVINLKRVPAGQGVSYDYRYRTEKETTLALVPFGYADGIPRAAEGFEVIIAGERFSQVGRIAMDQFVVDVGDSEISIGDKVEIICDENSADNVAREASTINYEIVTRMGLRPGRVYGRA